jgi:Ser/Thr protein kinase RdoA (MazF antagonist)
VAKEGPTGGARLTPKTSNPNLAIRAVRRYGVAEPKLTPLEGGHFADVYAFTKDGVECVLRVIPPNDEIDTRAMTSILEWMGHLAEHGGAVTRPIRSEGGAYLEVIEDGSGTFIATACERASGILAETLPADAWTDALVEELGRTTGRMHAIARTYRPADDFLKRPAWNEVGNCFHPVESLDESQTRVRARLAEVMDRLNAFPRTEEDFGLIHGDLHGGNFFIDVDTGAVTVFDFDDCCYGWYAMDVAMALFDTLVVYRRSDERAAAREFLSAYLAGYNRERRLSSFWIERIPDFLKLLEIGVYTMVYRQYDPSDTESWIGKFMPNRGERIEQGVPYVDIPFGEILEEEDRP